MRDWVYSCCSLSFLDQQIKSLKALLAISDSVLAKIDQALILIVILYILDSLLFLVFPLSLGAHGFAYH